MQTILDENTFCLVNPGQTYDLLISENSNATETFNIHFGENFFQDALANCIHSSEELLNGIHNNSSSGEFPIRSFWKDPHFGRMIALLKQKLILNGNQIDEELLFQIFRSSLNQSQNNLKAIESMKSIKVSTRMEIMDRLFLAVDFMHSNYRYKVSIDEIAQSAMLSKFHFL